MVGLICEERYGSAILSTTRSARLLYIQTLVGIMMLAYLSFCT
jgi:hypothetical protein